MVATSVITDICTCYGEFKTGCSYTLKRGKPTFGKDHPSLCRNIIINVFTCSLKPGPEPVPAAWLVPDKSTGDKLDHESDRCVPTDIDTRKSFLPCSVKGLRGFTALGTNQEDLFIEGPGYR